MTGLDALLAWPWNVVIAAIIAFAGVAHGVVGFGFPLFSTPMVALIADVQTAVLVTLFPNLAVNLVSILRGGQWRESIARHWPVAVYVFIGTIVGTRVLIVTHPGPIKLLLAAMIAVYLLQNRLRGIDWTLLSRHPRGSALVFGLLGGFLSGAVNVAVPPLVIYFMALGLPALAMTQILNLCFFVGRGTQVLTLGLAGKLGWATFVATLPLTAIALGMLYAGMRAQQRIHPQVFQRLLRGILWAMAGILVVQVAREMG